MPGSVYHRTSGIPGRLGQDVYLIDDKRVASVRHMRKERS